MTKRDLRIALINHANPQRIIEQYFYDNFSYTENESQYWNVINFLEVVRLNNLWSDLEKALEE